MKEPNFDDRRVLQRAQQVVPLDKIRAQRTRKLWFLSGAFVIAMMLGAASALLAVHIKQRSQITQINTDLPPETSEPPETVAAVPVESPTDVPPVTDEEVAPPVKRTTPKKQPPPVIAQRPRTVGERSNEVEPSEEEQLEQIREAVLYDQWQERRLRRAARRDRRNRGDRDLSHVDETFEGPRRRERP
jgi:type IV secretory pathway VirB10-like protein